MIIFNGVPLQFLFMWVIVMHSRVIYLKQQEQ